MYLPFMDLFLSITNNIAVILVATAPPVYGKHNSKNIKRGTMVSEVAFPFLPPRRNTEAYQIRGHHHATLQCSRINGLPYQDHKYRLYIVAMSLMQSSII